MASRDVVGLSDRIELSLNRLQCTEGFKAERFIPEYPVVRVCCKLVKFIKISTMLKYILTHLLSICK